MVTAIKLIIKAVLGEKRWKNIAYARAHGIVKTMKYLLLQKTGTLNLQSAGKYHGTDKHHISHSFCGMSYLDIYNKYLHLYRKQSIAVLEIGIRDGASLRMWKSYFKKAQIYGIDIDPRCMAFIEKGIHIETGSQDDAEFLEKCFGKEVKFDLIIDDGSHINTMTIAAFKALFHDRMNSGGIYIIEDLHCSYDKLQTENDVLNIWPGMKYNDPAKSFDNFRKDMDMFFLEKINKLDHCSGEILFVHFWAKTCVIKKV